MNKLVIWCLAGLSLVLSSVLSVQAKEQSAATDLQLQSWCSRLKKQQSCYNLHSQLAAQGRAESAYWIAKAKAKGLFEEADLAEAAKYYQIASDQLHPYASRELGLLVYHGVTGKRDYAQALRLFEQAIEQGNSESLWALGRMYHFGRGVEQDYQKAFELFHLSAQRGSKSAASTLAYYYKHGLGTNPDAALAHYWENKADVTKLVTWNRSIPDYR